MLVLFVVAFLNIQVKDQKQYSTKEGGEILELINSLENQYVKADFENKAKMLKIILSNSVLTNEKPLFSYRKPFDVLAEFGKMELSSPNIPNLRTLSQFLYALRNDKIIFQVQKLIS